MSAKDSRNEIRQAGTIRIPLSLTPACALPVLTAGLLCALPLEISSDTTFNTQYPAPAGSYNRLTTTDQTQLAKDNGTVIIGSGGSGDDGYKMNVYGSLRSTSDAYFASSGGRLDAGGGAVLRSGADLSGFSAINVGTPVNPGDVASKAYVESTLAQACGATSCNAPEPACGQTTSGTNKCGFACAKTKPITDPSCCDSNTCNAPAPACGQTTTGTLNCGQSCSKKGPVCCVSDGSCSAKPACGQTVCGTDNCGQSCCRTGPACPPPPKDCGSIPNGGGCWKITGTCYPSPGVTQCKTARCTCDNGSFSCSDMGCSFSCSFYPMCP